jgi:MOSC domain-containing protein YiiM
MKLISINIGQEQTLTRPAKTEQTGIFKQPVSGPCTHQQGGAARRFYRRQKESWRP